MPSKYTLILSAETSWRSFSKYLVRWTASIWLCRLTN
jgi:hypothetical protein